jgi:hypothetical protein
MTAYVPYARFTWERNPQWWGIAALSFATRQEAQAYLTKVDLDHPGDVLETRIDAVDHKPAYAWIDNQLVRCKYPPRPKIINPPGPRPS